MNETNRYREAVEKALLDLDRRMNPHRHHQLEREGAQRRAQLAQDILLAMAPNAIDVLRHELQHGMVQQAAEAYVDLAVRMADALIERLNRKN